MTQRHPGSTAAGDEGLRARRDRLLHVQHSEGRSHTGMEHGEGNPRVGADRDVCTA